MTIRLPGTKRQPLGALAPGTLFRRDAETGCVVGPKDGGVQVEVRYYDRGQHRRRLTVWSAHQLVEA